MLPTTSPSENLSPTIRAVGNSSRRASKNSRSVSLNFARIRIRSVSLFTFTPGEFNRLWPAGSLSGYSARLCPCSCLWPRRSTDSGRILPAICVSPEFRSVVNPTPRDAVVVVALRLEFAIIRLRNVRTGLTSREGSDCRGLGLLNFETTRFTRRSQAGYSGHGRTGTQMFHSHRRIPPE